MRNDVVRRMPRIALRRFVSDFICCLLGQKPKARSYPCPYRMISIVPRGLDIVAHGVLP